MKPKRFYIWCWSCSPEASSLIALSPRFDARELEPFLLTLSLGCAVRLAGALFGGGRAHSDHHASRCNQVLALAGRGPPRSQAREHPFEGFVQLCCRLVCAEHSTFCDQLTSDARAARSKNNRFRALQNICRRSRWGSGHEDSVRHAWLRCAGSVGA